MSRAICGGLFIAILLFLPARLTAHDIPADATVHVFIKPDGNRLNVLVRMQMVSIHEIDWPVHKEDGTLDLSRIEPSLRDAATKWIGNRMDVYESDARIDSPKLAAVRLSLEGDASFGRYEDALAQLYGPPLGSGTKLLPTQGVLDALFEYPIQSDRSRFSFHPQFDRFGLRVLTVLRVLEPDGVIGHWNTKVAILESCGWIRCGIRRCGRSSKWVSTTSSMAPIICCFCSAL